MKTDPGDRHQALDGRHVTAEIAQALLDETDAVLELVDLGTKRLEDRVQDPRQLTRLHENAGDLRKHVPSSNRDGDSELAQQTAHEIDPCRPRRQPRGARPVQAGQGLLGLGLDGDRVEILIAVGFEEALRVSAVRLVTEHVRAHGVRRQQDRTMTQFHHLPTPMVG